MTIRRIAMAWLRKEDWPRWLALDPDFQPDYQRWLERMNALYAELKAQGMDVVKVEIQPEECERWASSIGRTVDKHSRSAFAVLKMQQADLH